MNASKIILWIQPRRFVLIVDQGVNVETLASARLKAFALAKRIPNSFKFFSNHLNLFSFFSLSFFLRRHCRQKKEKGDGKQTPTKRKRQT
jgi:hypothetical protein